MYRIYRVYTSIHHIYLFNYILFHSIISICLNLYHLYRPVDAPPLIDTSVTKYSNIFICFFISNLSIITIYGSYQSITSIHHIYTLYLSIISIYHVYQSLLSVIFIYHIYLGGQNESVYNSYLCKSGYYCKINSQLYSCPKGFFCPSGSSRPYPCTFGLITCPNDHTAKVNEYEGIYIYILYILLLL